MGTIKELKVLVEALREDVTAIQNAPTSVKSLTKKISELKVAHDNEICNYQRKVDDLELKLSTALKSSSTATLDAVTRFYDVLDAKVDKHNVRLNILEEDTVPSVEDALKSHKKHIDAINEQITRIPDRTNTKTIPEHHDSSPGQYDNAGLTLKSLEQRIDGLEDYSRRDNLLFYGFREEKFENCNDKVMDLICNKLLSSDEGAENIKFVRIHRLGKYKRGSTRPIIARFVNYGDKTRVLRSCGNLSCGQSPQIYFVSEDFSQNTTALRKNLQSFVKIIKSKLGERIEKAFVKYKFAAVKQNGKIKTYSLDHLYKIEDTHPSDWWESLLPDKDVDSRGHYIRRDTSSEKLVDTRAAPNGDTGPHPEPTESVVEEEIAPLTMGTIAPSTEPTVEEPAVVEDDAPLNHAVEEDNVPLDNGDSSPHTAGEEGESS